VRINYVMEFGNYGYADEMTGAGWQTPRIGWESEIPQRHWHQNDPGVVPNMLMTGAGSPTGMQVYEGDLLPSVFHGQPIHCDAGPNVVRGYITQPDGAGYKAEIVNLLDGSQNRWFRPSDVAVAPDGSLIVADWYDPGVGGHGMGDVTRGRLFRVTTKAAEKFQVPSFKLETAEGAVEALKSPNESARYLAWQALQKLDGREALTKLFEDAKALPQHRARALWLLTQIALRDQTPLQLGSQPIGGPPTRVDLVSTVVAALSDVDENLRITAVRAARQLYREQPGKVASFIIAKIVNDKSPAVRREAAIALRTYTTETSAGMWASLVALADRNDRWAIEALGIGAEKNWDRAVTAMVNLLSFPKERTNALWRMMQRARCKESIESLATIAHPDLGDEQRNWMGSNLQILRSLQLNSYHHPELVADCAMLIFLKADAETALAATALLDRNAIASNPEAKTRLDGLLKPVIGKADFVALVERLNLTGFEKELLDFISANPNAPESVNAARLIAANREGALRFLKDADAKSAKALIAALGRVSDRAAVAVMNQHFWPEKREDVRRVLIDALALSGEGGRAILKWQTEGKLPPELNDQAALALSRSTDAGVRNEAAKALPLPAAQGLANFPKLPELMQLKGDAAKGQAMFTQAGCVACHRVKGQFIDFGPDLTQIGAKLSKDGLFTAILYPSAAIEHSFVGLNVTTKEGQTVMGYVVSETDAELTLRMAGGATTTVKKVNLVKKEELKDSLMPPGLAGAIGPQGLADLVAWLQTLK
jgi:putative heme-binding domain-containing protein